MPRGIKSLGGTGATTGTGGTESSSSAEGASTLATSGGTSVLQGAHQSARSKRKPTWWRRKRHERTLKRKRLCIADGKVPEITGKARALGKEIWKIQCTRVEGQGRSRDKDEGRH